MQEDKTIPLLLTVASFLIVAWKMKISASKGPIAYILLFYFLFSFGPVINYLLDLPIYFGIPVEFIPQACFVMFLGISSFALPYIVAPEKISDAPPIQSERHQWIALKVILILASAYGILKGLYVLPNKLAGAYKTQLIQSTAPQLHYLYLLLELYLVSFYFSVRQHDGLKKLYWLNFAVYILYCLLFSERDFIFPLISIAIILRIIYNNRISSLKFYSGGLLLAVIGTWIFFARDPNQKFDNFIESMLNQGSVLFVNSFVQKIFDQGHSFFYGETFFNSFLNLIPSFIYQTDYNNLSWFKNHYAPGSDSGYGFALDAEGYINFGHFGVILVYGSIALYWKYLLKNFSRSEFFRYLTLFSTGFTMYCVRNDSLAFIKGTLYAVIFYMLVNTLSYLLYLRRVR